MLNGRELVRAVAEVKKGRKAVHVAEERGLPLKALLEAVHDAGIELSPGRERIADNPKLFRESFNRRHGPGADERFVRICEDHGYAFAGKRFGGVSREVTSRQRARQIYSSMTGGKPKPRPPYRPDLTPEKLLALAECLPSIKAVAEAAGTSHYTITKRAGKYRVELPKYPFFKHLRALNARRHKRAIAMCRLIQRLAREGDTVPEIAWILGKSRGAIHNMKYRYKLYISPAW